MSIEDLLQLRDDVTAMLSDKAGELKRQLAQLTGGGDIGRVRRGGSLKGRKVPPKYRGPDGETWAGRGAKPRWMQEAMKSGAKPEDFLITASGTGPRRGRGRPRKRKAA
jgi:DNA-binding protein H-NS